MVLRPFVIDSEQMICHLFEEMWGEDCYTLNSLEDAHFRIPDFNPDIILISCDLYLNQPEKVEELIITQIPLALMGFEEGLKSAQQKGWQGLIFKKPLEMATLKDDLKSLLS